MRQACSHRRLAKLIHNQEDKIDSEPEDLSDDEEEASDAESKPHPGIGDNDDLDFLTSALGGLKVVVPSDSILEETICSLCPGPTKKVKDVYCSACKVELRKYEGLEFSTKIRRIVRVLADIRKESSERKTIVFSQVRFWCCGAIEGSSLTDSFVGHSLPASLIFSNHS